MLKEQRGIEVGHIFLLGDKYSKPFQATYTPPGAQKQGKNKNKQKHKNKSKSNEERNDGNNGAVMSSTSDSVDATTNTTTSTTTNNEELIQMGCYGLGISRIVSAVIEANHDDHGIVWPARLSPYRVCIIPAIKSDDPNHPIHQAANQVYDQIMSQCNNSNSKNHTSTITSSCNVFSSSPSSFGEVDAIIDDRSVSKGVKMHDAELIGYQYCIVVGKDALSANTATTGTASSTSPIIEVFERQQGKTAKDGSSTGRKMTIPEVIQKINLY